MPGKHIARKKNPNGTTYIYHRSNYRRNKDGKAVFDEISIGKEDPETKKLVPNRNYWDIYGESDKPKVINTYSLGLDLVCSTIVEELGLKKVLDKVIPSKADDFLAIAYYMISEGNVISHADDWFEDQVISLDIPEITSQNTSRLFSDFTEDEKLNFFKEWTNLQGSQDYWVYDVTSISTYSKDMELAEMGYNRDKDNLKQINIGMCYGQSSGTPLFYQVYDGSIPDKTHFPFVIETFPYTDDNKSCFVLDQGFVTADNLKLMTEADGRFSVLTLLPAHWVDMKRIVDNHCDNIQSFSNYIREHDIYAVKVEETVQGIPMTVHLYYDKDKATSQTHTLYEKIYKLEKEMNKTPKSEFNSKKFKDYFVFDVPDSQGIESYERNDEAIDEAAKKCGFFALITSDSTISSSEALTAYREKDVIEKTFNDLKNGIDGKRMKTHNQKTTNGKLFASFLSLIIRSRMYQKTAQYRLENNMPMPKIINQLNKIKCTVFEDGTVANHPLNNKQKKILSAVGVDYQHLL